MPQQHSTEPSLMDTMSVVQTERQMDREDLQFLGVLAPFIAVFGGAIAIILAMTAAFYAAAAVFFSPILLIAAIRHKEPKTTILRMLVVSVFVGIVPIVVGGVLSSLVLLFGLASWQDFQATFSSFSAATYHTPIAAYIAVCLLIGMEQRTHWLQKPFREWCDKYIYKTGPVPSRTQRGIKDELFPHTTRQKDMIRRAAGLEAQPEMVDITPEISAPRTTIDFGEVGYVRQQEQPHDFDADQANGLERFQTALKASIATHSPKYELENVGTMAQELHSVFRSRAIDFAIQTTESVTHKKGAKEERLLMECLVSALTKIERWPISSKLG